MTQKRVWKQKPNQQFYWTTEDKTLYFMTFKLNIVILIINEFQFDYSYCYQWEVKLSTLAIRCMLNVVQIGLIQKILIDFQDLPYFYLTTFILNIVIFIFNEFHFDNSYCYQVNLKYWQYLACLSITLFQRQSIDRFSTFAIFWMFSVVSTESQKIRSSFIECWIIVNVEFRRSNVDNMLRNQLNCQHHHDGVEIER